MKTYNRNYNTAEITCRWFIEEGRRIEKWSKKIFSFEKVLSHHIEWQIHQVPIHDISMYFTTKYFGTEDEAIKYVKNLSQPTPDDEVVYPPQLTSGKNTGSLC